MDQSPEGLIGRIFGGYLLVRILGGGAMGTVYLAARADTPQEHVAVKVLTPPPQPTPADLLEFKARFRREAKALQLLHHPHILTLIEYGEDLESGLAYMVLPHMAGGTLDTRLSSGGIALEDAARYASQIADALDYAHGHGIVHRDLKPGNVLLDHRGEVHLADFGIAKIFDAAGTSVMTLTTTGQIMGTPHYMSPEQAHGQDVTASTDIYSFGMVLYHLATGHVAFEGKSLTQVLLQIATTPPIPPRRLRPTLPAPAEAAILRALAKQPADRFKSAGELARAFTRGLQNEWVPGLRQAATLEAFVPQQTIPAPHERESSIDIERPSAVTRPAVLIAAISALLIVAIAGTLLLSGAFTGGRNSTGSTQGQTIGSGSPTSTPTDTPTLTPPTATPSPTQPPRAGTVLYSADWSSNLNGWHGASEWKTVGGQLVSDGSAQNLSLFGSGVLAPYQPVIADYAVVAEVQIGACSSQAGSDCGGGFGLMARLTSDGSGGYDAGLDYLHWSYFSPVSGIANGKALDYVASGDPGSGGTFDPGTGWHTYRFEVHGNNLTLYIDGAQMVSITDNSWLDAGEVGLNSYSVNASVRSFQVIAL